MRQHFRALDPAVAIPFTIFTLIWGSTWIVIRDQIGDGASVSPHWSVTYRFILAAAGMAIITKVRGDKLWLGRKGLVPAAIIGLTQFCLNFNSVYLAERHITSGLVATFFALLLIPNAILAYFFLGQKVDRRFVVGSAIATVGIGLLFAHEFKLGRASAVDLTVGLTLTLVGMFGASTSNVYQAVERVRRFPLSPLLFWSMAIGAALDATVASLMAGPPTFDPRPGYIFGLLYLALAASCLAFSLYFPVVRKIGPARAAYSSVLVPIIAMALSTVFEGYRWSLLAGGGAVLALGGMLVALGGRRKVIPAPDAA
ncbi:DMT family transporter [Sphingomonas alba]|uniref:EamA family transporter n=1 Tax=Sphingomonas alba TaxID=2908208 RepID=A0ABT0RLS5_9SPHN|nr:EamA family transporter [Sphingomonas alba]MCL6683597.1 EamA family transporter [Sphingomonas alba]